MARYSAAAAVVVEGNGLHRPNQTTWGKEEEEEELWLLLLLSSL